MRKVSGFTIIELVTVITILGILAAVALPKFFSVQTEARTAAAAGVAGALASASAMNYGARLAKTNPFTNGVVTVGACTTAGANGLGPLLVGGFPVGFTLTDISVATVAGAGANANGSVGLCVVTNVGGGTAATAGIIVVIN